MVLTYVDPVKQESRLRLKSFIEKSLEFRKPEDIRVLCFPGAEADGQEALEVREIYDQLGIPRANITGLEYDPERAQRLRNANLGIHIEETSDVDFFRRTRQQFDVVSLDYTGQQTRASVESLALLAGRQLLRNGGVLCTNYSARRESDSFKRELLIRLGEYGSVLIPHQEIDANGRTIDDILETELTQRTQDQLSRFWKYVGIAAQEQLTQVDLDHLREAITCTTIEMLTKGTYSLLLHAEHPEAHIPQLYKSLQGYTDIREQMISLRRAESSKERVQLQKKALLAAGRITEETWETFIDTPEFLNGNYQDMFVKAIGEGIRRRSSLDNFSSVFLAMALSDRETKPYGVTALERYSYVSNKNYLMLMDMYQVRRVDGLLANLDQMIRFNPRTWRVQINPENIPIPKFNKTFAQLTASWSALRMPPRPPERTFLGSSWLPPKRMERISEKDAKELLRAGCTPAEIEACYSGFSVMQLAGFQAWITRRERRQASGKQ